MVKRFVKYAIQLKTRADLNVKSLTTWAGIDPSQWLLPKTHREFIAKRSV